MFNIIPVEFESCSAVPAEVLADLKYWGNEFLHPISFAENVVKTMWNDHKQLSSDVKNFIVNVVKQNHFEAGEDLGDFIALILGKPTAY